jgi:3-deoxy-D-manno-octulosonate 8-phosphate phosphatase (KDO 8-P phosphatase)
MISDDILKGIRLLLLDVDGVLTDGSILYTDSGAEIKIFNVKDGLGIRLLMAAGIEVGIITGRSGQALKHRCKNLGITRIHDGVKDKAAVLEHICKETGFSPEQVAYIGDDLLDRAVFRRVGLAIAVADAVPEIRSLARMTTTAKGGHGAVREVCEAILKASGHWDSLLKRFD